MSKMTIRRGRLVKQGHILVDSREDGSVHIAFGDRELDLTEPEALDLIELLPAITEWDDSDG